MSMPMFLCFLPINFSPSFLCFLPINFSPSLDYHGQIVQFFFFIYSFIEYLSMLILTQIL
ncbi:hypothetical protein HanHA300_Chr10g0355511 [Helianthus annuus]|nr:hypothetical protein HanHA300_Chr10g0355511 [Helianthus annuus]KAJ0529373.1 hypothetical protein HanHA89_Chr10g0377101 [Helianthus annuus]KAJ0696260.1 hypothetical protein HanLR1_Chr10g0355011 [Helianthus annuus]